MLICRSPPARAQYAVNNIEIANIKKFDENVSRYTVTKEWE